MVACEVEATSRRKKEELAVSKARGVKLANPNGVQSLERAGKGAVALHAAVSANAAALAGDLTPVLIDTQAAGHTGVGPRAVNRSSPIFRSAIRPLRRQCR
jgi:hypothetical protein